ncbi:MAG: hypothetical protein EA389_15145 [Ilumatobacter sp.]|nr:MAG: hypothetical protein EA389_15145 [Ilumatobacter sp.]
MLSDFIRRLRGDQVVANAAAELRAEMRDELTSMRELLLTINHVVVQIHEVVETLNHDVRAGAEPVLPMFLGHAERLRLDADTAIGATQVIERQLALLAEQVAALDQSQSPST